MNEKVVFCQIGSQVWNFGDVVEQAQNFGFDTFVTGKSVENFNKEVHSALNQENLASHGAFVRQIPQCGQSVLQSHIDGSFLPLASDNGQKFLHKLQMGP